MNVTKDPDAVLDYAWDWTAWLADGETISSQAVTASTGLTVDASPPVSQAAGVVTAWLSGGTLGSRYEVVCHVTTNQGRQDDRTIYVTVLDR